MSNLQFSARIDVMLLFFSQNLQKEPQYGADVLRWWAAMSNLQFSATIGQPKLKQIHEDLYDVGCSSIIKLNFYTHGTTKQQYGRFAQ